MVDVAGKPGIVMAHFTHPRHALSAGWFDGDTSGSKPVVVQYWAMEVVLSKPRIAKSVRIDGNLDAKLKRLLTSVAKGDVSRCSYADYDRLCSLPGIGDPDPVF